MTIDKIEAYIEVIKDLMLSINDDVDLTQREAYQLGTALGIVTDTGKIMLERLRREKISKDKNKE